VDHLNGDRHTIRQVSPDRSRLLLEINNAIVSHLGMRELLGAVSGCLRREIPHDLAGLALYDPETQQLKTYAMDFPRNQDFIEAGVPIPLEGTPEGLALTSGRTVLIKNLSLTEFPAEIVKRAVMEGLRSGCAVPLMSHGNTLGTLSVVSLQESAFTEEDAELLGQIGTQVAIAVENALNFERARKAERKLMGERDRSRLLLRVNNALVSHVDLRDLLKAVSTSLQEVIRHDFAGLALYDPETKQLLAHAVDFDSGRNVIPPDTPLPLEGTPGGLAFTSGKPVYIPRPDPEKFPSEVMRRFVESGFKSGCSVPLMAHGRSLGVLAVGSSREEALTPDDVELLTQIAQQVAIAVENSVAFREIEKLKNKLAEEKLYLEDEIRTEYNFEEIIGGSVALKKILKQAETVAATDSTVLICGETGTGKELVARAIHNLSGRCERTLVKVNCAAIPTGLLESELFGHEKGAFTGAITQRIGRFELAHRGTLFLDEVGDIPLELQPKLLRVLQEQEFERLGSVRTQRVDVRLVAATNCNLEGMVADKEFRRDLFYRLNVFPIMIPPLRDRPEDIPLLVRFFAQKFARRMKKPIEAISAEGISALVRYSWPGNVRELENLIERSVILSRGSELHIPLAEIKGMPDKEATPNIEDQPVALRDTASTREVLENIERQHILTALRESGWVVAGESGAASRLGMKRSTLQARMRKLGISRQS
jgi:formate hydrogenlyase transcriptional activator